MIGEVIHTEIIDGVYDYKLQIEENLNRGKTILPVHPSEGALLKIEYMENTSCRFKRLTTYHYDGSISVSEQIME